ncbi:MAG: SpoIIE family protein phosphatase [Synechococcaceae cyanobacterium SM2_3_2]|nr:SpoIIE family protein phosphatase [Synechococcaceae cyanobacterium SM2_3_2]
MRSTYIRPGSWKRWLKQLPLESKLTLMLLLVQTLALAVGGTAVYLIRASLVQQLRQQSITELSIFELVYQQQLQQTALGFRAQAENPAIIAAAENRTVDAMVRMSFLNELWQRNLEIVSLLDVEGNILISPYYDREGSRLGIDRLIQEVRNTGEQVIATELLSHEQLAAESPRMARLRSLELQQSDSPQSQFLVQYTVTPVRSDNSVIAGFLVSGDIIQPSLIQDSLAEFNNSVSAIYWGQNAWMTNLDPTPALNVSTQRLIDDAIASGELTLRVITIEGSTYTVAVQPLFNLVKEPVGILLQATSHDQINRLLFSAGILPIASIGLIILVITLVLGRLFSQWMIKPLQSLGSTAQAFAEGDLSIRTSITAEDELGILAKVFNQMADRVQARTESLQAELNVARKLQQMILPRDEELKLASPFDVAVFMQAATEVGGDYYDVLSYKDTLLFGIGDVTGHGLESGVLMIMVQMAIRTLLTSEEADTHRILQILNQVVYANLQRMGSDRNLTLCLLKYDQGELTIIGQHEEVLLVKNGGDIQRIDTLNLGMFVGLEPTIDLFLSERKLQLGSQDVVVLYTDGLTEAEAEDGSLYGLDRLSGLVKTHADLSAHEIRDLIVADTKGFIGSQTIHDDITLMVLKHR